MGRPREYEVDDVIVRARDVFWERGYGATSIADLEAATGLDRSSLYHAFGSKQALFEQAARQYVDGTIDARLDEMRQPTAGLEAIANFFGGMARTFRADPAIAARGCLVVNTVAELSGRDDRATSAGADYRDRFREAFGNALRRAAERGEVDRERADARARILTSTTLGLFTTARIDPADAARVADEVGVEVSSWRSATGQLSW